jgi:hypothetical protein
MVKSTLIVKATVILAVTFALPFALFEGYVVARLGMTEPYTYMWSIPLGIISYILLQFAICYAFVKGWRASKISNQYGLIAIWLTSVFLLFILPRVFPPHLAL